MAIIGAILGDIAGSQYEFSPAVKEAILSNAHFDETLRKFGREYPNRGFGGRFFQWLHAEGVKGAVVTAMCIYMARTGASKEEILKYAVAQYPKSDYKYSAEYSLAEYRDSYEWDVSCQGSVPAAIRCFYESEDYESFIRNVFSLNCDRDTLAAIGGGVAEEFYHGTVPDQEELLKKYLSENLYKIVKM